MHNNFFIGCTHWGHSNILKFTDKEGNLLRGKIFSTIEEHDEVIVQNWNKIVRSVDKVYHLGDVVINRRCLPILSRLNGRKVLVKGNHDIFHLKDYIPYFEDIVAYKVLPNSGIIFSHVPLHPQQFEGRFKWNGHAHLHQNIINDLKYINLCVEHINYTPIELEEVLQKLKERNID
jgi:calcineurin-like phosphoesterase family protein